MTLKEFLQENSGSIGDSGGEWDSCEALKQLNRARSLIYSLGNWDGLTTYACVSPCSKGRFVTPWFASEVKAAYTCRETVTINSGEYFSLVNKGCCGNKLGITDTQTYSATPVPIDELCRGFSVFSGDMDDEQQTITVVYHNNKGSVITDEFQLTEAFKKYRSSSSVKKIVSISKPPTSGEVHFHSNEKGCPYLFSLSPYESSQRYRIYCINANECGGCCGKQIVLKMRKKCFPYTALHYHHQVDLNSHALALGMQAISALDQRTPEGLNLYRSLVREVIDLLKKEQTEKSDFSSDTFATLMNTPTVTPGFGLTY